MTCVRDLQDGDHETVERLWPLFQHDMSAVTGQLPDRRGRYREERLRRALGSDPDWRAYLIEDDDLPVGFALVRGLTAPVRVLNSFFVVAAARRRGVGRAAVRELLDGLPGRWEIAFQDINAAAAAFWRRVATDAAGQRWVEEHRAVPGRPDLAPDSWISFRV